MSTSDRLPGEVSGIDPSQTPGLDLAQAMAQQIQRLANEMFAGGAGPGSIASGPSPAASQGVALPSAPFPNASLLGAPSPIVPPHVGPHALNVGAGGASPAVVLPPIPGALHRPPLAATPPPKESDFRAAPTLLSENLGFPSAIEMGSAPRQESEAPYFLSLAGIPATTTPPHEPTPGSIPTSPTAFPSLPTPTPALSNAPTSSTGFSSLPTATPGITPTSSMSFPSLPTNVGDVTTQPANTREYEAPVPSAETSLPGSSTVPSATAYDFQPEVVPEQGTSSGIFDPNVVKRDFPILRERVHGREIVWLDNAATTQKPQSVIDRISYFYEHENSNVHRAAHTLAARSSDAYEAARDKVRRFLNAPSPKQIVFVRGATEGINLVAQSWGRRNISAGDEIVITWLEHHANIVPWQQLCSEKGARLRVAPVDDRGDVILDEYERLLGPKTKLVSLTQVSNALGTITPAREMVEMAHRHGARVLVDGAQAVSHMPVDVQTLDCDFYVFSGHKVFAPTGIGALFGKAEVLEHMPPWQSGGNMIADVTFEKTTYQQPPWRFEAGTGNIADAVGLGAAIDYVSALGMANIERYEHELLVYAEEHLARVPGLSMVAHPREKAGVLSFVLDGVRTEDVGGLLDQEGIAVRSGHHCAQPILRRFGYESSVRASLAPYNTREDIDALVAALLRLQAGRPNTARDHR